MLIGLTGSLGSGKSTVRALFEKHGMRTIDCDALVKDILHDDASMKALLIERWGDAVLDVSGEVNRNAIAQKVFKDAASLAWLESELHPRVRKHWTAAVTAEPIYDWLIEVPLLFEKNLETLFDYTLCVACSLNVQQRRLGVRRLRRGSLLRGGRWRRSLSVLDCRRRSPGLRQWRLWTAW